MWQEDVLIYRSEKDITWSKQDQYSLACPEQMTIRENVNGVSRYVTHLLRSKNAPLFDAPKEAVMPSLQRTERHLTHDPEKALVYEGPVM